jgi:hypothetical protein
MNKVILNIKMNNLNLIFAYNKMNDLINEIRNVRRSLNNITDETIQKKIVKGYYIKNYKAGQDILKSRLGQHLRYDISKRGKQRLAKDLGIYEKKLDEQSQRHIKSKTTIHETKKIRDFFPNFKGEIWKTMFPTVETVGRKYTLTTNSRNHILSR